MGLKRKKSRKYGKEHCMGEGIRVNNKRQLDR